MIKKFWQMPELFFAYDPIKSAPVHKNITFSDIYRSKQNATKKNETKRQIIFKYWIYILDLIKNAKYKQIKKQF
ncbi:Uncharacterised protein [Providencia rustigianii]|nr:Uncharacterised protein [Providencia rustigianii]